jgi:hypothetical protein
MPQDLQGGNYTHELGVEPPGEEKSVAGRNGPRTVFPLFYRKFAPNPQHGFELTNLGPDGRKLIEILNARSNVHIPFPFWA